MRTHRNIWSLLKILAITLIVINILLTIFEYGRPNFNFKWENFDLIYYSIRPGLSFIIALILSTIYYFIRKKIANSQISFKKTFLLAFIVIITFSSIKPITTIIGNRKIKVETEKSINECFQYDIGKYIFSFSNKSVIDLEEKGQLTKLQYDLLLSNCDHLDTIKIKDIFYKYYGDSINKRCKDARFNSCDSVDFRYIENVTKENIINGYLPNLIKEGGFKVYDKRRNCFLNYIYYQYYSSIFNLDFFCFSPSGDTLINRRLMYGL